MSTGNPVPSTAKRSPSILVTDVRTTPLTRPAPFARTATSKNATGPGRSRHHFDDISIDNILSDTSDIPSAQKRTAPSAIRKGRGEQANSRGSVMVESGYGSLTDRGHSSSLDSSTIGGASHAGIPQSVSSGGSKVSNFVNRRLASNPGPAMNSVKLPPLLSQNLPSRTSKVSQKLVLIPDEPQGDSFHFDDTEGEDLEPPPTPYTDLTSSGDQPRRSYAERLSRDRRANKFPRVTAYCIADGMRLHAISVFLRDHHKIRPRVYDEALFAPYYLPLLPGDGEGSRVKSSPGGIMMLEQLIDQSEQGDHHYEYFSSGETPRGTPRDESHMDSIGEEENSQHHTEPLDVSDDQGHSEEGLHEHQHDWRESGDFDPSEPQDFSPRAQMSYIPNAAPQDSKSEHDYRASDLTKSRTESISEPSKPVEDSNVIPKPREVHPTDDLKHAEMFIFSYGVVVFWNFTENQEKAVLADIMIGHSPELGIRPINDYDIETEEMHFTYSPHTMKPRIYNDMITLRSGDHMIKLAMSHAIAQSTKLSRFESRMDSNMHDVKHVPRMLALTGKLGMKREEVLKISGKLFKLRVDVNLSSNVLDTPDFFWESEPSLNPLYTAMKEYLEIEQRILVLNERCKVFLELADIIADSIAESNMSRITWIIIVLIVLSMAVSMCEIILRFAILTKER